MPFSSTQINRILADNILPATDHPLTLSQRVTEAYIRRKLYAWEDGAVIDLDRAFKATYAQLRAYSARMSEGMGVHGTLKLDAQGQRWRSAMLNNLNTLIGQLFGGTLQDSMDKAVVAYQAGYYGRAWAISQSTTQRPSKSLLMRDLIRERVKEEWAARYADDFSDSLRTPFQGFLTKARGQLTIALQQEETPAAALLRIKTLMGVGTLLKLFYEVQLLERTLIMAAANLGALALYRENLPMKEAVGGVGAIALYLTAGDRRVCYQCQPYNGRMFRIDTLTGIIGAGLFLPMPPQHMGCRCTVLLIPLPEFMLPPDMPPGLTLGEWLLFEGIGVLDEFMDRRELDSSQVGEEVYSDYYG